MEHQAWSSGSCSLVQLVNVVPQKLCASRLLLKYLHLLDFCDRNTDRQTRLIIINDYNIKVKTIHPLSLFGRGSKPEWKNTSSAILSLANSSLWLMLIDKVLMLIVLKSVWFANWWWTISARYLWGADADCFDKCVFWWWRCNMIIVYYDNGKMVGHNGT